MRGVEVEKKEINDKIRKVGVIPVGWRDAFDEDGNLLLTMYLREADFNTLQSVVNRMQIKIGQGWRVDLRDPLTSPGEYTAAAKKIGLHPYTVKILKQPEKGK